MSRRIAALRALAERPGTEHEGIVAREMLRRAQERSVSGFHDYEAEYALAYNAFARGEISIGDFIEATMKHSDAVVAAMLRKPGLEA